jgi:hypothetical protein
MDFVQFDILSFLPQLIFGVLDALEHFETFFPMVAIIAF